VRENKMTEISLGTNDRNNFVLDKGDRKAYLNAKHLGRLKKIFAHRCRSTVVSPPNCERR
jgi:hypothetical protein